MIGWIDYKERRPKPEDFEILAFNKNWINEDFNPKGIRIGFQNCEEFISAYWWDYQDTYMNQEEDPEFWIPLQLGNLKSHLEELFKECEHGDQEHRDWLKGKFHDFYKRKINEQII